MRESLAIYRCLVLSVIIDQIEVLLERTLWPQKPGSKQETE